MAYHARVTPAARGFLDSLSPDGRDRLFHCWELLEHDPDVDRVYKFYVRKLPWTARMQHCGGFDTLYGVDEIARIVEIRGVAPAGLGGSLIP